MENKKVYIIEGSPIPLARGRHTNGRVYDAQKAVKLNWSIYIDHQHGKRSRYNGPLHVIMRFFFPMPQNRKKMWDRMVNSHMYFKPDVDNLSKFVLDVTQKVLFDDDAQVARLTAEKLYGYEPRTEFEIIELERLI